MSAVRTQPSFRKGGHRFQDIFVNGLELRREVRQEGRTFVNLADYLRKYHGWRHFDLVAGSGKHIGAEWWIQIRYRPWWERLFASRPDGQVWSHG